MSHEDLHEAASDLSEATRDMHRAIVSLIEELEAVDWYQQRVDACKNPELRAILAHNRDEEKEHAAWLGGRVGHDDGGEKGEGRSTGDGAYPVLRSPAATPLIEIWIPRFTRSMVCSESTAPLR